MFLCRHCHEGQEPPCPIPELELRSRGACEACHEVEVCLDCHHTGRITTPPKEEQ